MKFNKNMNIFTKNPQIYKQGNVSLYFMSIKDLRQKYPHILNWSKNRKPDQIRINQIKQQYSDPEKEYLIDGLVSAWYTKDKLYIYDGIHRYEASKNIHKNKILIKIITTNDEAIIVNDFKNINKSISLPYIFLEDQNELKVSVCNKVSELMISHWPMNQSPSRAPWRCNYNRDIMVETIFSKLEIDFTFPRIDSIIYEALKNTNEQARFHVNETKRKDIKQKTRDTNFYLRYFDTHVIKHKMETYIKTVTGVQS